MPKIPLILILTLTLFSTLCNSLFLDSSKAQSGGVASVELWCVAMNNAEDAALQSALDWACGAGGADCGPIQQGGVCYDPTDIQKMASYAFNDYYLKHGMTDDACSFDNTAAVTSLNPSHGSCKLPSSLTVNNGSSSGSTSVLGLGPSVSDMNGCNKITHRWYWPFIIGYTFFLITRSCI